jgi:hypothetical protein
MDMTFASQLYSIRRQKAEVISKPMQGSDTSYQNVPNFRAPRC